MQNRGNFVLNKAHCLMNIDDADLCVYPKSTSEREREGKKTTQQKARSQHPAPLQPPKKPKKKKKIPSRSLFNDASRLGGILPTDRKRK